MKSMKATNNAIEIIKKNEGLKLTAYLDVVGVPTIGWGSTRGVKMGMTITRQQAEELLRKDVQVAENDVNSHNIALNQNQYDALVSFTFNLGGGNLRSSTLLKKIKANPCDPTIRAEFDRWVYAGGKVMNGLVKRRKEEAELYFRKELK